MTETPAPIPAFWVRQNSYSPSVTIARVDVVALDKAKGVARVRQTSTRLAPLFLDVPLRDVASTEKKAAEQAIAKISALPVSRVTKQCEPGAEPASAKGRA